MTSRSSERSRGRASVLDTDVIVNTYTDTSWAQPKQPAVELMAHSEIYRTWRWPGGFLSEAHPIREAAQVASHLRDPCLGR